MKIPSILALAVMALWLPTQSHADATATAGVIKLEYTDGREATLNIEDVNAILRAVGVRVSTVAIPQEALPILEASHTRPTTPEEDVQLISVFELTREDLLAQIEAAGRTPTVENGGSLTTAEPNGAPYPKIHDMKKMNAGIRARVQSYFAPLHINHSKDGVGIDEVMTLVSGGPWQLFFELPGGVTSKLTLGYVGLEDDAWRVSYPGLVPHGAFTDPEFGLVVAYAHGPDQFSLNVDKENLVGSSLLGTNPWVDWSGETPKLLDTPLADK